MSLNDWRIKDLLALPFKIWDEEGTYDSLIITSTRKKHDSGWALIAIIGVRDNEPVEVAAQCDDINWSIGKPISDYYSVNLRTDCLFPAGAMHIWQGGANFVVGPWLSSTDVTVIQGARK